MVVLGPYLVDAPEFPLRRVLISQDWDHIGTGHESILIQRRQSRVAEVWVSHFVKFNLLEGAPPLPLQY